MSLPSKTYDSGRIAVIVNGVQIQGFAPDSVVKVSRDNPSWSTKAGADGMVVRSKNRNQLGKIVISLMAESPSNDYLSTLINTDENTDGASPSVGPSMVKDLNGNTLCQSKDSWVLQPADVEFGNESGTREWTIVCAQLKMIVGSNTTL